MGAGYTALKLPIRDAALLKCVIGVTTMTEPSGYVSEVVKRYGRRPMPLETWEDCMGDRFRDTAVKVAISPLRNAQNIKMPVLLLHGSLDSEVFVEQSRTLWDRLAETDGEVRLVEFAGDDPYLYTTAGSAQNPADRDRRLPDEPSGGQIATNGSHDRTVLP